MQEKARGAKGEEIKSVMDRKYEEHETEVQNLKTEVAAAKRAADDAIKAAAITNL